MGETKVELIRRALPFVIPLELLELTVAYIWPAYASQDTYWGLVVGFCAFLFLNGIFAPTTLTLHDARPWLRETVPAFWMAMVLHAVITSAVVGVSFQTAVVALVVQALIMLAYICLMARVPTLPTRWRRLPVLFIWWLVANAVIQALWQEGINLGAAVLENDSPELRALFGGLATLLYTLWNLLWIGVTLLRQPRVSRV